MIEAAVLVYLFTSLGCLPILRLDPPPGGLPTMLLLAFLWPLLLAVALIAIMVNGVWEFM